MTVRTLGIALALGVSVMSSLPAQSTGGLFVIRNVRVFDGEQVAERQTVIISDGTIVAVGGAGVVVPPGAEEVAGDGRTLLPGLMDAHIHLPTFPLTGAEDALRQLLTSGVTTAMVMWAAPIQLATRVKAIEAEDRPDLAAVVSAGIGATTPGGHPTQLGGGDTPTLKTAAEADAFVTARFNEGSDFLKIIFDDISWWPGHTLPSLDAPTVAALATAAHAKGKIAVAHIGTEPFARAAITAGVDGLAHLYTSATTSEDFGAFAAAHHVFIIPTLSVLYASCRTDATLHCEAAPHVVRQLAAAHAAIVAGTDTPAAPGLAYGTSLHEELEHLVAAGMTPTGALTAATSAAATAFRLADRGRIRAGLRADLLLVDGDPTTQIRDTRNIVAVWKRGVLAQRASKPARGIPLALLGGATLDSHSALSTNLPPP